MEINEQILKEATGVIAAMPFTATQPALINTQLSGSITFVDDKKFVAAANSNSNIGVVITEEKFSNQFDNGKIVITTSDARHCFYSLINFIARQQYEKKSNNIHTSVKIHTKAFVADHNVTIGVGTVIEPNVNILPDVIIGSNCIIRAGAVLGSEGFEHKRTKKGILSVLHNGNVFIGNDVEIGANNTVDKGFSFRHTIIGDFTKTDNLVHIAHGVHIGNGCFIAASAMLAGSVTLKDDVWIGPGASIASQVIIGTKAQVTIGAVVVKDVEDGQTVSGNFAIPHRKFLKHLARMQDEK